MKLMFVPVLSFMILAALAAGLFFRKTLRELDDLFKWGDSDD